MSSNRGAISLGMELGYCTSAIDIGLALVVRGVVTREALVENLNWMLDYGTFNHASYDAFKAAIQTLDEKLMDLEKEKDNG